MFCPACRSEYPSDWKACPTDTTLLLKSNQIGKYTIEALLGTGGMGAVYKASNPDTRGRVAIKVMNPAVASSESARARFQREAAAVAALNTTHVVKVYDFGTEADGTLYLVMELLDGHPLRSEIQVAPNLMDLARVHMITDGALRGLAAAHKAGIVHRDLKPDNIFVAHTDDGEAPKLVDFGIARVRSADSDLTRTGTLVGTASYMAPEQIAAGVGEIGPWSDVYAMGLILYEMLSGNAAFGGDTITSVLQKVLRAELDSLRDVRPGLPPEIYQLIERCISSDPAARPQDAEAMRRELAAVRLVATGTPVPSARLAVEQSVELARTATPDPAPVKPPPPTASVAPPSTIPPPLSEGRPPSKLPIVLGVGAVIIGGAVAFGLLHRGADKVVPDAAIAIARPIDAAPPPPIDAAVMVAIDAPAGDPRAATMVRFDGKTYELGVKNARGDDRHYAKVELGAFWIDRREMTKGELAKALGAALPAAIAAKQKADPDATPARFVDWATAAAACKAVGKRLPTEDEWEAAARSTPNDRARARLRRSDTLADLTTDRDDCSPAGLCDMLGSLLEWTASPYSIKHPEMVVRGSSYRIAADDKEIVISIDNRQAIDPSSTDNELGFRCAKGD